MIRSFMIETFEAAGLKPWEQYITYVRRAYDQGVVELLDFLEVYDSHESRKGKKAARPTPEELCKESGTPEKLIIGSIAGQLWELGYRQADMFLALQHGKIVERAVKEALKPGGFKDRENLLKANGVVPIPKNNSIHFHKHIAGGAAARGDKDNPAPPAVLPSFEEDLGDYEDDVPQLPAGR